MREHILSFLLIAVSQELNYARIVEEANQKHFK